MDLSSLSTAQWLGIIAGLLLCAIAGLVILGWLINWSAKEPPKDAHPIRRWLADAVLYGIISLFALGMLTNIVYQVMRQFLYWRPDFPVGLATAWLVLFVGAVFLALWGWAELAGRTANNFDIPAHWGIHRGDDETPTAMTRAIPPTKAA